MVVIPNTRTYEANIIKIILDEGLDQTDFLFFQKKYTKSMYNKPSNRPNK